MSATPPLNRMVSHLMHLQPGLHFILVPPSGALENSAMAYFSYDFFRGYGGVVTVGSSDPAGLRPCGSKSFLACCPMLFPVPYSLASGKLIAGSLQVKVAPSA